MGRRHGHYPGRKGFQARKYRQKVADLRQTMQEERRVFHENWASLRREHDARELEWLKETRVLAEALAKEVNKPLWRVVVERVKRRLRRDTAER